VAGLVIYSDLSLQYLVKTDNIPEQACQMELLICILTSTLLLTIRICAEESMEDLNSRMEVKIPIVRFRPNVVLQGGKPFDEDNWAEITIGDAGSFWLLSRSPR
jgi:uncharacterized protein YcbX